MELKTSNGKLINISEEVLVYVLPGIYGIQRVFFSFESGTGGGRYWFKKKEGDRGEKPAIKEKSARGRGWFWKSARGREWFCKSARGRGWFCKNSPN